MGTLCFTVSQEPEHRYTKTVEDGTEEDHLMNFFLCRAPYQTSWFPIDGEKWLRRDAVVSVEIVETGASIAA
jgi:hypothetical protein